MRVDAGLEAVVSERAEIESPQAAAEPFGEEQDSEEDIGASVKAIVLRAEVIVSGESFVGGAIDGSCSQGAHGVEGVAAFLVRRELLIGQTNVVRICP